MKSVVDSPFLTLKTQKTRRGGFFLKKLKLTGKSGTYPNTSGICGAAVCHVSHTVSHFAMLGQSTCLLPHSLPESNGLVMAADINKLVLSIIFVELIVFIDQ